MSTPSLPPLAPGIYWADALPQTWLVLTRETPRRGYALARMVLDLEDPSGRLVSVAPAALRPAVGLPQADVLRGRP